MERLNAERSQQGLDPLGSDPRLDAVAETVARLVTERRSVDGVHLHSQAIARHLASRGYVHRLLVVAYATGAGAEQMAAEWHAVDPDTWQRFFQPDLRDVAVGRGETDRGPFHLLLAAVTRNEAKARESEGLQDLESVRREVLERTNELRREAGVVELRADRGVDGVAQDYAEEMLRRGFYGHTSPEGETAMDRLRAGRILVRRAGENLAEGPPTAADAVASWNESPSHRRNLLHGAFRKMGLGVAAGEGPDGEYKVLWVQLFTSHRRTDP